MASWKKIRMTLLFLYYLKTMKEKNKKLNLKEIHGVLYKVMTQKISYIMDTFIFDQESQI